MEELYEMMLVELLEFLELEIGKAIPICILNIMWQSLFKQLLLAYEAFWLGRKYYAIERLQEKLPPYSLLYL